ncbi:MAG: helix-turn-helix transcriptional regulator [Bacteroidales bacterium]
MEIGEISQRLKSARLNKGLSRESLSVYVGLSENSYRDIENGKTRLFHPKLKEIAKQLDISMEHLFFGSSATLENEQILKESIEKYGKQIEELELELEITKALLNTERKMLKEREATIINILGVIEEKRGSY